jgi:hypothetical protein
VKTVVEIIASVEPVRSCATLADLHKIVQAFPHLDRSDTSFEDDIIVVVAESSQLSMPVIAANGWRCGRLSSSELNVPFGKSPVHARMIWSITS